MVPLQVRLQDFVRERVVVDTVKGLTEGVLAVEEVVSEPREVQARSV